MFSPSSLVTGRFTLKLKLTSRLHTKLWVKKKVIIFNPTVADMGLVISMLIIAVINCMKFMWTLTRYERWHITIRELYTQPFAIFFRFRTNYHSEFLKCTKMANGFKNIYFQYSFIVRKNHRAPNDSDESDGVSSARVNNTAVSPDCSTSVFHGRITITAYYYEFINRTYSVLNFTPYSFSAHFNTPCYKCYNITAWITVINRAT